MLAGSTLIRALREAPNEGRASLRDISEAAHLIQFVGNLGRPVVVVDGVAGWVLVLQERKSGC